MPSWSALPAPPACTSRSCPASSRSPTPAGCGGWLSSPTCPCPKPCCTHWTMPPTRRPPTAWACAPLWTWCRRSSRPARPGCTCTPSTPPVPSSTCCTTQVCGECPPLRAEHATGRRSPSTTRAAARPPAWRTQMSNPLPTATILGYPRIGENRELKRALESYWAGRSSAEELRAAAADVRRTTRQRLTALGLDAEAAAIPSDFAYYDQDRKSVV